MERSYRRAPKGAGDGGDYGVQGGGICHLCTCGQGVDWEDLSLGWVLIFINHFGIHGFEVIIKVIWLIVQLYSFVGVIYMYDWS